MSSIRRDSRHGENNDGRGHAKVGELFELVVLEESNVPNASAVRVGFAPRGKRKK